MPCFATDGAGENGKMNRKSREKKQKKHGAALGPRRGSPPGVFSRPGTQSAPPAYPDSKGGGLPPAISGGSRPLAVADGA